MKLYSVSEKGELNLINKLEFSENDLYLVDDEITIYIWVGINVPTNKKEIAINITRDINKKREESAKVLIIDQHREYGSFLAMMQQFKKGLSADSSFERRAEFKLEVPQLDEEQEKATETDLEPDVIKWLNQLQKYRAQEEKTTESNQMPDEDLKNRIRASAYFISLNRLSYNELCWMLAEKQLIIQLGNENVTEDKIRKKAEEIFRSSSTNDELCWLMAEINVLIEKGLLKIN